MLIDGMKKNAGTMSGARAALLVSESELIEVFITGAGGIKKFCSKQKQLIFTEDQRGKFAISLDGGNSVLSKIPWGLPCLGISFPQQKMLGCLTFIQPDLR